ncbi:glycosyltransferase family 2 protein [Thermofilum sp.]|uniref:glycosyltransferase family 2 protein n=1 Tax=Thermofilum sp. TaxID=1961369 RepID=UPI00258CFAF1|nr:glycosyltransferase family 2 protein [Thermofilum sp.]
MSNEEPVVTFIFPSKNEEKTIAEVIQKAQKAAQQLGLTYEIIVPDNSTDATPQIARSLGAKVVTPDKHGYGYAYIYALRHARGKYIVMADADGTYDLEEAPKLLQPLLQDKADIVLGTRLKGKIMPGAMPWLHRYIGNPLLTFILNKFYGTNVSDAHTGFRAAKREAIQKLNLNTPGMEFASEFLAKAAYLNLRITEVPITYHPRREGTQSKLNSFRDGWRHLKFLLILAPKFLYYLPGAIMLITGITLMLASLLRANLGYSPGIHSAILGSMLAILGANLAGLGLISDLHLAKIVGRPTSRVTRILAKVSVEQALALAMALVAAGGAYTLYLFAEWIKSGYRYLPLRGENALALALIVLGIEAVATSMAAHLVHRE